MYHCLSLSHIFTDRKGAIWRFSGRINVSRIGVIPSKSLCVAKGLWLFVFYFQLKGRCVLHRFAWFCSSGAARQKNSPQSCLVESICCSCKQYKQCTNTEYWFKQDTLGWGYVRSFLWYQSSSLGGVSGTEAFAIVWQSTLDSGATRAQDFLPWLPSLGPWLNTSPWMLTFQDPARAAPSVSVHRQNFEDLFSSFGEVAHCFRYVFQCPYRQCVGANCSTEVGSYVLFRYRNAWDNLGLFIEWGTGISLP